MSRKTQQNELGVKVPVNPIVLKWARETAGYSFQEVVAKLNRKSISAQTLRSWESGETAPTIEQLERLAYEVYRRPLAVFFFPKPPFEESPRKEFRTLPDQAIKEIPPSIRVQIRNALALQENLRELIGETGRPNKTLLSELRFNSKTTVKEMAADVRTFLGISVDDQKEWGDEDVAMKKWRDLLVENGIYVFKDAFKASEYSGFCLHAIDFPVIFVNNKNTKTRQIFTLFHELAHLLLGTGGIDTRRDTYISALTGEDRRIEVLCNKFSSALLVPDEDFEMHLSNAGDTKGEWTRFIASGAKRYSVSREVILRKLFDRELVSQEEYDSYVKSWALAKRGKKSKGGNPYRTKMAYLGQKYVQTAFARYYQGRISTDQLATYLGLKVTGLPKMEALL